MYESEPQHPTISSIESLPRAASCAFESDGIKPTQAALGKKRQNVDATPGVGAKQRRRDRYADQRTAASIFRSMSDPLAGKQAGRGVTMCSWTQIAGQETRLVRVDAHKALTVSKGGQIKSQEVPTRAFYRGLQVCGLRWVCPCCTIKKSEVCRSEMNAALAEARKRGLQPVMLTLTARHKRSMPLAEIQGKIASAEKRLKTTRHWKRLMKIATGGFAKAVEVTHGANGWHPHFHIILLLNCDSQPDAFEKVEVLREAWLHELTCAGLDGTSKKAVEHSFDYCGAEEAGDYVSKWGAGEEMTLAGSKVGRGKGRTPWQLLRDARSGETDAERTKAAALWWEFIQVMKGVHQLRQSPAFRQLVKEYEAPIVPDHPEPKEMDVFSFGKKSEDGLWLFARHRRLRMIEVAEHEEIEKARQSIQDVMLDESTDEDLWRDDLSPSSLIEDS